MFDEDGSIQNCISGFENASQSLPAKELKFGICISEEHFNLPEDMSEEDMSVLLDLQRLTVQLAKKTRICFRDSFYRLAENSRHDSDRTQNSKETTEKCGPATVNNGSLRSPESKAKNSNTNAIDRTVATLMFNTVKCCNVDATRIPDLIAASEHHGNFNVYSV
ncbi:Unknown protein [Striga hermonthica]|uniref:Uncharacterized protein n=1 Tax=Striga hermonthica TaxID=68872 RepID=A0A9N7NN93_STRHE|nr:Unknown protein [Striga hermonthica]